MRKTPILVLALLSVTVVPVFQRVHAAAQIIDGVVSDTMCGKKHMMPGKPDAQCVQKCVKSGSSYALVAGGKVYTLAGKPQTIAPFAGKHVKVEGELKNGTVTVSSIHAAKAEMPSGMPM